MSFSTRKAFIPLVSLKSLHVCLLHASVFLLQSLPVARFHSQRPEMNKSKHALFRLIPHGQHCRCGISETEGSEPHLLMERKKKRERKKELQQQNDVRFILQVHLGLQPDLIQHALVSTA